MRFFAGRDLYLDKLINREFLPACVLEHGKFLVCQILSTGRNPQISRRCHAITRKGQREFYFSGAVTVAEPFSLWKCPVSAAIFRDRHRAMSSRLSRPTST